MNETQLSFYIREILKDKKLKEGTCGYSQDGNIDPENTDKLTPAGPSIQEALSPEVLKRAELIKNTMVGKNRDKIVKKYGPEAEKVIHGRAITQAKQQIEKEQGTEEIEEVSSEKQRKYMCAVSQPGAKRPKGLSQAKAKEMCSDTALSKKKLQEDIIDKTDFVLPRGKKMILQAEDEDYNRGLIVELTNEGGYKMYYWYGDDAEVYPVEVEVDGESIKPDAKEVYMKFHPELKENKNMKNTRLTELIKSALMKETSTDKYDDNPALKGKQSDLPDGLQKAIIKKSGGKVNETRDSKVNDLVYKLTFAVGGADSLLTELIRAMSTDDAMLYLSAIAKDYDMFDDAEELEEKAEANESFDSLVKKVDKAKGYTKKEAEKVAGAIAAKKMKGAGKGPTAKQKKRMAEEILKELKGNINENKSAVYSLGKDLYDHMTNVFKMKGGLTSPIKADTVRKGEQFTVIISDNGGKFDDVRLYIPIGKDNINKEYIQKNIVDQVKRKYKELETKISQVGSTGNNKAMVTFTLTGPNLFQAIAEHILKELRG